MTYRKRGLRGFSLLEVLVTVALFAGSVTAVLALLPGLSQRGAETADRLAAQRLPDAIKLELERLAGSGFDALAGNVPVMGARLSDGFALCATRNGARVQARDYLPPAAVIPEDERYFLIECWRFPDGPLRFDGAQPTLALAVRVSWPYAQDRRAQEFIFVTSLNR